MDQQQPSAPAGWHPDPNLGPGGLRWWDGVQWTTHTHLPEAQPAPVPVPGGAAPDPSPTATPAATDGSALHDAGYDAVVKQHLAEARAAMEADPEYTAKVRRARMIGVGTGAVIGLFGWFMSGMSLPLPLLAGAAIGWFLGPAAYRWWLESKARERAHDAFMTSWATARGWTYQAQCPQWNDVPFLRQGDDRTSEQALSGELWPGVPGHIYNFTYEVESTDSDGNDTTSYYPFTVIRADVALGLPQLQVRPRAVSISRMFDRVKGGVTSRRPVKLESREFEERFVLEVDDASCEIAVRTLFDPVLITHCIDAGKSFPALQANASAIVFARKDHYDASDENGLAEIDELIATVRPTVDRMAFNMRNFGAAGAA